MTLQRQQLSPSFAESVKSHCKKTLLTGRGTMPEIMCNHARLLSWHHQYCRLGRSVLVVT